MLTSSAPLHTKPKYNFCRKPAHDTIETSSRTKRCCFLLHKDNKNFKSQHDLLHAYVTSTIHPSFSHHNTYFLFYIIITEGPLQVYKRKKWWSKQYFHHTCNILTIFSFPDPPLSTPLSFTKPTPLHLTKHSSRSLKWFQWLGLQDKSNKHQINAITKRRWVQHVYKLRNINFYLTCNSTSSCILSISSFPAKYCKQESFVRQSRNNCMNCIFIKKFQIIGEACAVKDSPGFQISSQLDLKFTFIVEKQNKPCPNYIFKFL